jgi:hypothetical protein
MSLTSRLDALLIQRDQLKAKLAATGDMRPGSLVARFRKCGKPSCHCAQKDSPGHGPSYSLTHPVDGKTVTRIIPKGEAVECTRQQIAEYRRFRALVRQLVALNEQICEARLLSEPLPTSSPAVKKNFARRPARARRRPGD